MTIHTKENNRRIAKNTLALYFRMILTLLVTLYTSRVILAQLGVEDYGIYNVVGGVVMMFAFLNNCMTTSTQRFLTFELGKKNEKKLKKVFSIALGIHLLIAIVIVILAESIGLWFLNQKLNIPEGRLEAANWVYQFSLLTFCVNIIQIPYNAALIAHEKMNIYAYISIVEVFLKLLIAYMLVVINKDKLVFYGIFVFLVQLLVRFIYQVYCKKKYEECRFHFMWDKYLFFEMAGFASWNLFGSVAWLLRDQGVNILLNMFFGPVVNAARGVALQVSNAIYGFITNFQVALNPQITKNYATGAIDEMEKLVFRGVKFSFFLLFLIAFPCMLNIEYILHLWLKEVPSYTAVFVNLILIDIMVSNLFGVPFMTSLAATGRIKTYQICVSFIICMIIPASYIALRCGLNPVYVFYITIFFTFISGVFRFLFCKIQIGFSLRRMCSIVLFPILFTVIVSIPFPIYLKLNYLSLFGFVDFVYLSMITLLCVALSIYYIGLHKNERQKILSMLKRRFQ